MATSQKLDPKSLAESISEFAPALDSEAVYDRPIPELTPFVDSRFQPGAAHNPTGGWADNRSSFGLDAEGGPSFVDPGSFALGEHMTDLMAGIGLPAGPMQAASNDLTMSSPVDYGGGGGGAAGGGGGGGGGGDGGGGGVSSGGSMT